MVNYKLVNGNKVNTYINQSLALPSVAKMRMSSEGKRVLTLVEGEVLKAYRCSANVWTIGVGITTNLSVIGINKKPYSGLTITRAQSQILLDECLKTYENSVKSLVRVPLTQSEFDALVSICFNIGPGNFAKSKLLGYVNGNNKTVNTVSLGFNGWLMAGGKRSNGLVRRRAVEIDMFFGEFTKVW